MTSVAIVHDYLTQRGGAERVVLSMLKAFPGAPLYTSLYEPDATFPEFAGVEVRTLGLNRARALRKNHRLALPLLASAFSRCSIDADVVLCSSSGWAHGVTVPGRKVVYCYSPARWLYQTARYLGQSGYPTRCAIRALRPRLLRWDRHAASTADAYLTPSTAVAQRILEAYGIEASTVAPPHTIRPDGPMVPVERLEPGYFLCVSRLLPYKNLDSLLEAFAHLPEFRLVLVGTGPERQRLREAAPPNVAMLGAVPDEQLRWLYARSRGLVAASYEDYGLTPLEAAAYGKPAAVLRWGGFLDTVVEGRTGVFFDTPDTGCISAAVLTLAGGTFSPGTLRSHASQYTEAQFIDKLRRATLGPDGPDGPDRRALAGPNRAPGPMSAAEGREWA